MSVVLGLVELEGAVASRLSLQMLTLARSLTAGRAASLEAIVMGEAPAGVVDELSAYGVETVRPVEHELVTGYGPTAWAEAIVQLVGAVQPEAVLAAGSDRGNEVMANVGAHLDLPMVANCTKVEPGEPWEMTRVRWGGSLLERTRLEATRRLLTVAPHIVTEEPAPEPAATTVEVFVPTLSEEVGQTRVREHVTLTEGVTLATAPVVVSGGRGVGGSEGFAILEELAELLGGRVGCSRVATNNGWRPHSDQVGQTGTRVAPDLYIACGISGAIQHWVGMAASQKVLAINTDTEASMVTKADYAVLGDLHEVLPAIVAEVRKRKG